MARLVTTLLLVFLFFGLVSSGESPYPEIKKFNYDIEYRKIKTLYVDFVWEAKIQGKYNPQKVLLSFVFYDSEDNEIHSVSKLIKVDKKKLQTFDGREIILLKVANEVENRGGRLEVNLGALKKY